MHLVGFGEGFLLGFVGGVAFLPEELGGAEKEARAHLPAHHVGPLVDEEGEITIGFRPAGKGGADDGFGGGADDVGFGQFSGGNEAGFSGFGVFFGFEAVMGDYGAFGGEAFGMLGFFFEVGEGDQEGEVSVLVAGSFELGVEIALDGLPNGVAPRFDDHAAAGFGVFGEVGRFDDLLIPFGEIFGAGGGDGIFRGGHERGLGGT